MRTQFILFFFLFLFFINSYSQDKPAVQSDSSSSNSSVIQIYDSSKVCDGYILWMDYRKCSLLDRKGNVLYNIPGNLVTFLNNKQEIVTHNDGNLVVYNKDLDVLWKVPSKIEHELIITPENDIMFFSEEYDSVNHTLVYFNNIVSVDSTRKASVRWSSLDQIKYLLDFMMKDRYIFRFKSISSSEPDSVLFKIVPSLARIRLPIYTGKPKYVLLPDREFFHLNSIQFIPENKAAEKDSVFKKGNMLICFNSFSDSIGSFIAIVDPVDYKILWYYVQKDGRSIHTPLMLPDGHILLYINSSVKVPYSGIDEIDPVTKELKWYYIEDFPEILRRNSMGSCQRLPNGNTLISNMNGYIYEVTPDKKIVWQWYDSSPAKEERPFMYRAFLYSKEELNWLLND